jgi:hypothetical protein
MNFWGFNFEVFVVTDKDRRSLVVLPLDTHIVSVLKE